MNRCLLLSGAVAQLMMLPCAFMVREIDVKSAQVRVSTSDTDESEESKLQGDDGNGRPPAPAPFEVEKFEPRRASPWQIALEVGRTRRFWKFFLLTVMLVSLAHSFTHTMARI